MYFTPSPDEVGRWWSDALGAELHREEAGESVYTWLDVDGVEFGFHMADEKRNPHGGSTVTYWSVDDVDAVRQRLLDAGCTHHRGPLQVVPGRKICQVIDPFGIVIGLDGP
ncbi:VOC family protein [Streptomyces sp. RPA4-5]|uniref:VOC family protein n=1 Tax=Streptomyces TaxID=1883 RepID=UPI00143EE755|nr:MULTISPECIES: VOC family protein [Streptomyces]MCX4637146.1 VOC family protein [Streptomyces platensis]QIY59582.1 VOC family protein [Streptomyces sp. RPA4-5]WJY36679.1 VOC family protein [Streptomyces sp. P9-2B-2]